MHNYIVFCPFLFQALYLSSVPLIIIIIALTCLTCLVNICHLLDLNVLYSFIS